MSNFLDSDQDKHPVSPDLGPNYLHFFSRLKESLLVRVFYVFTLLHENIK